MTPQRTLPRVLFVGVGAPWRGSAGYLVRQSMFLNALVERARLHLALLDCPLEEGCPPFTCELSRLPMPGSRRRGPYDLGSAFNDLISPLPNVFQNVDAFDLRRRIVELKPDQFDAVFAYRIDFAYYAGVLDHPRLLLDIDDPEHIRRRERFNMLGDGHPGWYTRLDLRRLRRFERDAARRAMASFVCQEHDQRAFAPHLPYVVPNCVDAPLERPPRRATKPSILFVGNLEAGPLTPNVDGLQWFLKEIWPLVLQGAPDAQCRIVGLMSKDLKRQLAAEPQVISCGFVEHLQDELAQASLSIAPIRFGSGTRIKILESLTWGCPVVSTSKGCEGLAVSHGRDILIASEPRYFAEHCIRLMRDTQQQEALSRAGFQTVKQHYDRKRQHAHLVELLGSLIGSARSRRTGRVLQVAAI